MSSSSTVVGFIRPPPDIRVIVDKTAQFIGKNGDEFESKIIARETGNLKFNFLKPEDPYYAYYRHKVDEFRTPPPTDGGKSSTISTSSSSSLSSTATTGSTIKPESTTVTVPQDQTSTPSSSVPSSTTETLSITQRSTTVCNSSFSSASSSSVTATTLTNEGSTIPNPIAKALRSFDISKFPHPPKAEYSIPVPSFLTTEQMNIIQLTAQFTAVSGRKFLHQLSMKEYSNPLFDFLKERHALFGYFTALVDVYAKILNPSPTVISTLTNYGTSATNFLERAIHVYEYTRIDEEKRRQAAEGAELERAAIAHIDWHDFVVVETIDFHDDDVYTGAEASSNISTEVGNTTTSTAAVDTEEDMEMEMETETTVSSNVQISMEEEEEDTGEKLRIQHDYVPQVANSTSINTLTHYIDPKTGHTVPIEQASEHLRIELIDSKWKEQVSKAQAQQAVTLYASGDEISENLRRLAATRRGEVPSSSTTTATSEPVIVALPQSNNPQQKRNRLG